MDVLKTYRGMHPAATARLIAVAVLLAVGSGCGLMSRALPHLEWRYSVHYEATSAESRRAVADRLRENPDVLVWGRYRISALTDHSPWQPEQAEVHRLTITCTGDERRTAEFMECIERFEEALGPELLHQLKVIRDLYPLP